MSDPVGRPDYDRVMAAARRPRTPSRHRRDRARRPGLALTAITSLAVVTAVAGWSALPSSTRSVVAARVADAPADASADTGPVAQATAKTTPPPVAPTRATARVVPQLPRIAADRPVAVKPVKVKPERPRVIVQPLQPVVPLVPATGSGRFTVATGAAAAPPPRSKLVRYTVEIENGLRLDPAAVSHTIDTTLADRRSWPAAGFAFRRTGTPGDLRILLATPGTVDKLCAPLDTGGEVSCRNEDLVVLNARRWVFGAASYGRNVAAYRQYLVNHEVGHFLGRGHVGCPVKGGPAPVMLQQTLGLQGCKPNPWPILSIPSALGR